MASWMIAIEQLDATHSPEARERDCTETRVRMET